MITWHRWVGATAAFLFLTSVTPSAAQSYPDRPVRIIVPTAPGGSIDTTGRVIGNKLSELWRQPVVIENRPGASMIVGADAVAKSPADGYTLLVAHDGTMAMNPVVYPTLSYDPVKDFAPVSLVATIPLVMLAHNSVGVTTVAEFVELAKKNPGKLNHASGGTATLLALELFKFMAGVNITNVMYRGGAPAVTSTVAGETQFCIADLATANAGMQSSNVRVLAVTSLAPTPLRPALPTVNQTAVPGYETQTWTGVFAPAAVPQAIVAKIESDVKLALTMPDVRSRFEGLAMDIKGGTSEELRKILADDIAKWSRLVKATGFKLEP